MKVISRGWMLVLLFWVGNSAAELRYNDVLQKSFHNSYQKDEGLMDQLVYHRARSIELDIRATKNGHDTRPDDWFVYHIPVVDTKTNCHRLSNCFQELKVFDEMHPNHEVVTVWFDVNSDWGGTHTPDTFDALVRRYFADEDIVKPSDLMAACPGATTIRQAVTNGCDWPTLDSMKGKWMFVMVGGGGGISYVANRPNRVGYGPGGGSSNADIDQGRAIFLNLEGINNPLSTHIANSNLVSRRYYVNSQADFNTALAGKVHHIATDKINYIQDSWAKTHNANGWPFTCVGTSCNDEASDENIITIKVNSEDIWGKNDHFGFLYQDKGTQNGRWITSIGEVSSHVEDWAKGCLMARASTASNSPYFAVCRAADNKKLRIQYRLAAGQNTKSDDNDIAGADGLDQPNLTYVKIDIYGNGKCATGFGSQDGKRWTRIGGGHCFNSALKLQGVGASSHGNNLIKHTFSNLSYWGNVQTKQNFTGKSIGTVRYSTAFDGSMDRQVNPLALSVPTSGTTYYDVGPATAPLFPGYLPLTAGASIAHNPYGWTDTAGIGSRDRGQAAGNAINRDLLFHSQPRTFEQPVQNGNWYALVTFGDVYYHENMAIDVEGERKLDGITNQANQYFNRLVAGHVTDGKFSITFSDESGVDPNWTITRIILSDQPFGGQAPLP